jgi:DNA-binding transcriptional MerR regulator
MAMKMSELVKRTDTPKSTILFYIKEGLLPEPQKPKPNLHLYDDNAVELIGFIKYLQTHFGCSIEEIKTLFGKKGFDLHKGFEVLLETLDVIMGAAYQQTIPAAELCERCGVTADTLERYVEEGLLFRRDGHFTQREAKMLAILREGESNGLDPLLLRRYVEHARALAQLEVELGQRVLQNAQDKNSALKTLFDTLLVLKPYLFNMHTLAHYRAGKDV